MTDFISSAVIMVNCAGLIEMVSAKTEKLFGYGRMELVGRPFEMLLSEGSRALYAELWQSFISHPQSPPMGDDEGMSGLQKAGAEFPVEIIWNQFDGENGTMMLATVVDITDRRRRMEESGYLAAILEFSSDAIISMTLTGIITTWNLAAEAMFGYSADEIIGLPISLLFPPHRLEEQLLIRLRVRKGERCQFEETTRRHKDGREIAVSSIISPIFGPDGNVSGSSKIVRDITGVNLAAKDSRESATRYTALSDLNMTLETRIEARTRERDHAWKNSQDLQVVVDANGIYQSANEAWTSLLGWQQAEVVGHNHLDFIHPDDHGGSEDALSIASKKALPAYENRFRHKDGSYRWISWVAAPEDELIYASGRNVTLEKEAAVKLAAIQEQLRQSQKMELLGQLTGGIAHDFNNLLGIVQLNLELIQERLTEDSEAVEMTRMALHATERGASLTHQLLAYARQQPLEPKTVNIETLVSGMAGLLERTLGENIAIKTIMPAGLWTSRIDPHQLENALLNLGVNALHAMPDGGKLIIQASNKALDEIYVDLNPDVAPGEYVMVAVTDTGIGMSADILERVLEPFFTTKPVGKGSGLGLSMVHGFAKQSGGHLKIYSEPGHGTTVNLYLPRASHEAELQTSVHQHAVPASTGGESVLVVEDDPFLRSLTLKILAGLGYRTIEAEDGPAACEIMTQTSPIDLLLTDIVLPSGMYGPEIALRLRSRWPGLRVLYMSGYPRDAIFHNGALDNARHLLSKPFSKTELARTVRLVLDERDEI